MEGVEEIKQIGYRMALGQAYGRALSPWGKENGVTHLLFNPSCYLCLTTLAASQPPLLEQGGEQGMVPSSKGEMVSPLPLGCSPSLILCGLGGRLGLRYQRPTGQYYC